MATIFIPGLAARWESAAAPARDSVPRSSPGLGRCILALGEHRVDQARELVRGSGHGLGFVHA